MPNGKKITSEVESVVSKVEAEKILHAVLNNAPENIILTDKNYKVIACNEVIKKTLFDYFGREVKVGDDYREFVIPPLSKLYAESFCKALKGESTNIEVETTHGDTSHWFRYIMNPVYDDRGKMLGISLSAVNIDDRKKTENALKASEENYRSLFERASDAIMVTDMSGNFFDVNTNMCKWFGYSKEEFLKMNIKEVIDPLQYQHDPVRFDLLELDKQIIRERRMITRNGEIIEVEANVKKIGTNKVMAIVRDLTNIRKVERQIAVSESTLRSAFQNSAVGMALVSPEGNFLKVNKELCRITGYTEKELLNLCVRDITHPDDLNRDVDFIEGAQKGKRTTYRVEKRYLHKNKSVVWINLNSSAVKDENGILKFFVAQMEDITQKRQISEQLKENENLLRMFVEHSPAALAMFDKDMKYIQVSKRWITDYHLDGKQVIGQHHYDVFTTIPKRLKDAYKRCLAGAIEKCDEDSFVREDGKLEWLQWEVHPWRKASGEIGGIIMFTEVITTRKETELKFRNLVERSLAGVYIIQDGKFVYVNPFLAAMCGYTVEELTGMDYESLLLSEYRKIARQNLRSRLSGELESVRDELRAYRKDGSSMWLEVFGTCTLYQGRIAIIGTLIDITERKTMELEREKIINDILQKNRDLEQFAYIVSHNIRSPLAKILGLNYLMKTNLPEVEKQIALQGIESSAEQLDTVIKDLNEVLKLRRETTEPKTSVNLKELTNDVIESLKNIIAGHQVRVDYDFTFAPELPAIRSFLYNIFHHLVSNAIKYSKPEEHVHLSIRSESNENQVVVYFTDNGLGIDMRKHGNQLFGLYKRFHLHIEGKGLGLFMVKTQVEAMGGTIEARSNPGVGTEFILTFTV